MAVDFIGLFEFQNDTSIFSKFGCVAFSGI